jgi:hypothetical protein
MQLAYLNAAAVKLAADGPGLEEEPAPQPPASTNPLASAAVSMVARREIRRVWSVLLLSGGWVRCVGIVGGRLSVVDALR